MPLPSWSTFLTIPGEGGGGVSSLFELLKVSTSLPTVVPDVEYPAAVPPLMVTVCSSGSVSLTVYLVPMGRPSNTPLSPFFRVKVWFILVPETVRFWTEPLLLNFTVAGADTPLKSNSALKLNALDLSPLPLTVLRTVRGVLPLEFSKVISPSAVVPVWEPPGVLVVPVLTVVV